ncbi:MULTISPECIES: hypothetical protein [Sphingomonas]|uniref:hypothetical protein n=1 Tax=Sphingomonas TaxID=13687 RepID=UPI00083207DE|nr:hypothetical protein [Sphingomonas sp. CCH10-B3]
MRFSLLNDIARTIRLAWFRRLTLLAASLMIGVAPAAAQMQYTFDQRVSGAYDAVQSLPSIGVLPFRGQDGNNLAAAFASELQALRVGDRSLFAVRTEDSGAAPGRGKAAADVTFVRAAGARLGVKGVLWGDVVSATVASSNYTGSKTVCKGLMTDCRDVSIACTKFQGSYTVNAAIYDVDTGRILYTKQLKKDSITDVCGGEVQSSKIVLFGKAKQVATTPDSILTALRLEIAKAVVADFQPMVRKASVAFKNKFPEFDKETQAVLMNALAQLKSGRADKACGAFEARGNGVNTTQLSLLFNLAACAEVNGNIRLALELYQSYDSKITAVDPMINNALRRLGAIK